MASSIFARIGTIKGESRDARHKDEIDVLSWAWGLSQAGNLGHGGGGGSGKVSFQDLKASGFQPGDSCNGHRGFLAGGGEEP